MFGGLFKSRAAKLPAIPEGITVYAIGDVHGRADLLAPLINAVFHDPRGANTCVVVFLGDYIDRGPASRRVVDMLIELSMARGAEWHFLRGNHEQAMLDFLVDPMDIGPAWGGFGGRETLESYGVEGPYGPDPRQWRAVRDRLELKLPESHKGFLESMPTRFELGDYFFAHAGARPGVALERQHDLDLMRIRGHFLDHTKAFEKVVVHGHSIVAEVHSDHRRIGVDTGAYASGMLTALRLEGEGRSLLQTQLDDAGQIHVVRRELGPET